MKYSEAHEHLKEFRSEIDPEISKWQELGCQIAQKIKEKLNGMKSMTGYTLEDGDLFEFYTGAQQTSNIFTKFEEFLRLKEAKDLKMSEVLFKKNQDIWNKIESLKASTEIIHNKILSSEESQTKTHLVEPPQELKSGDEQVPFGFIDSDIQPQSALAEEQPQTKMEQESASCCSNIQERSIRIAKKPEKYTK